MTTPVDPLLDRAAIRRLFTALGERLRARGVVADIYGIGGGRWRLPTTPARRPATSARSRAARCRAGAGTRTRRTARAAHLVAQRAGL